MDIKKPPIPIPTLDPNNVQRSFLNILLSFRELAARVEAQEAVTKNAGISPHYPKSGELAGVIQPWSLVHVTQDGVAFLASNTETDRFATDIVLSVSDRNITCVGMGLYTLRCQPFSDETQPLLYLGDVPGFATDVPPTDAGTVRQVVGFKKGGRDTRGLCSAQVRCGEYTLM